MYLGKNHWFKVMTEACMCLAQGFTGLLVSRLGLTILQPRCGAQACVSLVHEVVDVESYLVSLLTSGIEV
jgi:hypothetical protein